jgi:uncharacterized repeat protein (TIGR01451 family)
MPNSVTLQACRWTAIVTALIVPFATSMPAQVSGPTYVSPKVKPYDFKGKVKDLPKGNPSDASNGVRKKGGPLPVKGHTIHTADPVVTPSLRLGTLGVTPAEFSNPNPSFDAFLTGANPPDTNGAVGPNHYVSAINQTVFSVWDKQGNLLAGPTQFQSLWANATPPAPVDDDCRVRGRGDPYVVYDHLADRWVLSQLANKGTNSGDPLQIQCIAVSKTPDPTDGWYVYTFDLGVSNDYPKLAVWPDGYYLITQEGYDGHNLDATVFDRANMLNGNPASFQRKAFLNGHTIITVPSELEGPLPPNGSPNLYVRPVDGDIFGGNDRIEIYEFHVDWGVPANTTFTLAQTIDTGSTPALAPFNSDVGAGDDLDSNTVPQPGTATKLDAAVVWPRSPLHYRNFGDHETLVFNHSVNATGDPDNLTGVRWYELRRSGGLWSIFQQSTFSPPDGLAIHRWMGSIAIDRVGNIAIGYNVSNDGVDPHPEVFPGIRYAGRLVTDPPGELPFGEIHLTDGSSSKTGSSRWGDYSMLRVDPVDGCTFWYTNEYFAGTPASPSHRTHVGAFRFPTCNPADLSINKSDSPDPVIAGNQLDYTIGLHNNGPSDATNVVVTDTLPSGVVFLSSSIPCTGAGLTKTCNIGGLANGATTYFTIQVRIPANFLGAASTANITNTATVAATESDPITANNTATATTNVIASADVSITKTCKPDSPAAAGSAGFCDLTVTNLGVSDARNVIVVDALTSNSPFQVTSYTPPAACTPGTPSAFVTSFTATCSIGTLAAGGTATIRVNVTANTGGDINDTANVSSTTPDPVPSNNQATGHVTFFSVADLSITKVGAPNPVVAGTNLTYTLTASNAGPSPATNVVVTDTLPGQISVVSVTPSAGSCSGGIPGNPAQPLICGLGTLNSGQSRTIIVVVKVNASTPDGTILINNGAITSDTNDPNNNNNVVTANAPVIARADLSITKTADQNNYKPNALITFTVKVTNNGASDALAVIVTDNLPDVAQSSYLSDTGGCTKAGLVLTCNMGNMPVGTSKSFDVRMIVKGNRGTITNNATVASSTTDPVSGNNATSKSVGVK